MAAKRKLVPNVDVPQNKLQVSKTFMLDYVQANKEKMVKTSDGAEKNIVVWFKALCENTKNKDGSLNIKEVRMEFCNQFFPELNEEKPKKTFWQRLDELEAPEENT